MTGRNVVLDTNVVVSAALKAGSPPAHILEKVLEGEISIAVCPAVIAEYRDVMSRPKFRILAFPPVWFEVLLDQALLLPDPPSWPKGLPDPDDAVFLSLAHESRSVLVSGNLKHYPRSMRRNVHVMTPTEFVALL